MTDFMKNLISEKHRLHRLSVSMPQYNEKYMSHIKLLKKTFFIAKSSYYSNKLNLSNCVCKSTWETLNHVIKPNRKFPTIKRETDNSVLTDPTEIASKFTDYFHMLLMSS